MKLLIVAGTLRRGRRSLRVAEYIQARAEVHVAWEPELLDVEALELPVLWERRHWMEEAEIPAGLKRWHKAVTSSDAVVLVAPEYNGGYPAALKNILDAMYSEYERKPFGLVSVSAGMGGYTVLTQLREVINRMKGFVVPTTFMARDAVKAFDEAGNMVSPFYEGGVDKLLSEVAWYTEAIVARTAQDAD